MGRTFSMVLVGTRFKVPIPRRTDAAGRAAMPYAQGFDPLLIVAQIGSMQALWYLTTN